MYFSFTDFSFTIKPVEMQLTIPLIILQLMSGYCQWNENMKVDQSAFDELEWLEYFPENVGHIDVDGLPPHRVIGGQIAKLGQFPYQAGLFMNYTDRGGRCGGVLISDKYVLTAAHCAVGVNFINVYLGALEIKNLNEGGRKNLIVRSEDIVVHSEYNPLLILNDIALLELPEPIKFTDNIQSIGLPTRSDVNRNFADLNVIASGWGRTSDESNTISDFLNYAEVTVQPYAVCKHFFNIPPSNICTETNRGQGVCNGDSGGPLAFTEKDGTRKVLGLSSFVSSIGCVKRFPSVYVRVSHFLDWIAMHSGIKIAD